MKEQPTCEQQVFSPADLLPFNGKDAPSIYISFLGCVYDVTSRPDMYGGSAPYHIFAGRECARSLATVSLDPIDVGRTDIMDLAVLTAKVSHALTAEEVREAVSKAMKDWQEKLAENYPVVGQLRPWLTGPCANPAPQNSSAGPTLQLGSSFGQKALGAGADAERVVHEEPPGPLEILCRKPRIYMQRRFLSETECLRVKAMMLKRQEGMHFSRKVRVPLAQHDPIWSDAERSFLDDLDERISRVTGGPSHEDEVGLVGMLTPGGSDAGISDHLGLHVDTNAAPWRYCTVIIYLSTVATGGETVFPAAIGDGLPTEEEERAFEAAGRLLDLSIVHTDMATDGEALEAANDLLDAASLGTGMKVQPEDGTACIFWTRQNDGEIDRHSWHGGAPVPDDKSMKWTLQKFKEVPIGVRKDPAALADFVKHSRSSMVRE